MALKRCWASDIFSINCTCSLILACCFASKLSDIESCSCLTSVTFLTALATSFCWVTSCFLGLLVRATFLFVCSTTLSTFLASS